MTEVIKRFAYHRPSEKALDKVNAVRLGYSELHALILRATPNSREQSVAITELETSAMWAIKSIVINDADSVVAEQEHEGPPESQGQ